MSQTEIGAGYAEDCMSAWSSDYYDGSGLPMTQQWQALPRNLTVRCPRCSGPAGFEEPFGYAPLSAGVPESQGHPVYQHGDWYIWAKYPAALPFPPPVFCLYPPSIWTRGTHVRVVHWQGTYALREKGVLKCSQCHLVTAHKLHWPHDAFYQWHIADDMLWAPSREYAEALLEFLRSKQRNPDRFPQYQRSFARLPKAVIAAKARDTVVKAMLSTLNPK